MAPTLSRVHELSQEQLDALIEEAILDTYNNEEEELAGFAVMIEENLEIPFETTVLGVTVKVENIIQTGGALVADCVRAGHRQPIRLTDLPLPDPAPEGAEWIAAYRHWSSRR